MKYFPCVLFLLIMVDMIAQDTQNDSITRLDEVVLTQDAIPKKATGITVSSKIAGQTFERFNPIDIPSAINQISGVYILSGAINTNRITVRGMGARTPYGTNKLRMYFNGIPVTNGTGSSTIEAYDFENLGAVEVIKGPKASAFGANLGGAILLDTKASVQNRTQLINSFTIGSYNMLKDNLTFSHSEDGLDMSLSYNHLETDGYRQNSQFQRDGLLLNTKLRTGQKSSLALLVNYIDYTAHIPSSINLTDFEEDPTRAPSNWLESKGYEANKYILTGLSHTYQFSEQLQNTTSIFYTYLDHYEPRPFDILDEFTNGYGFRSRFAGNWGKADISFGGEFYRDEYHWGTFENLYEENNGNGSLQGSQLSDNSEFRRQFNLFGTFTYPITERFSGQIGLNWNKTHYDFRDLFGDGSDNASATRDFDAILLPNVGLSYQIKNGSIYANVSRGFSNPSLEETLTPGGVINPDIAQETGTNYELGTEWMLLHKKLGVNLAAYQMDVKNLLVAQRIGEDQYIGRNAGKTRHQGVEIDLQYRGKLSSSVTFSPYLSYTLNDHNFVDFVDGENNYSGNPLTGVPKNRLSSGIDFRHSNGLRLNLTHQFVDDIPITDSNSISSDSFNVFHAKLGFRTSLLSHISLGINAGVNNIFDTNYAQSVLINAVGFGGAQPRYYYPGNGRNYFGGLQLNYVFQMNPRIQTLPVTILVGKKSITSFANNNIFELWQGFSPRKKEINHVVNNDSYAVEIYPTTTFFQSFDPTLQFERWAAIAVSKIEEIPEGMESLTIPEGLYAVFPYKGKPSEAIRAFKYMYGDWLPNSEYEMDGRPYFALMGDKYKGEHPESEEEFWVPIKKK